MPSGMVNIRINHFAFVISSNVRCNDGVPGNYLLYIINGKCTVYLWYGGFGLPGIIAAVPEGAVFTKKVESV
jgi:hypothetical protein